MATAESSRAWRAANLEHSRAYQREYQRNYRRGIKKDRPKFFYWRWYLKKTYGITSEKYEELVVAQGGGCAICGRKPPFGRFKKLSVDHDHATGKVRGLLCTYCNGFLGRIHDDVSKIARYLEAK